MNTKVLFNDGWEFVKSGLDITDYTDLRFEPVDLPHDWLIYNTLALYESSIGWYRRILTRTKTDLQGGQQHLLYFDGVYMDSSVYVNGQLVGEWKYGYSSFEHDITAALVEGDNEIIVKVVHQSPNTRWYSGAGIYRNVWLKTRSSNHIVTDGVYISTKEQEDAWWLVEVDTDVHIGLNNDAGWLIEHSIVYQGEVITSTSKPISVSQNSLEKNQQSLLVANPLLWRPQNPNLYQLVTKLQRKAPESDTLAVKGYEVLETITHNLGFRTVVMNPNVGFSVNGEKMKLNGVCEHHDLGALGAAFNVNALRRRFRILKEMGVNAIRTAHNMPAPELMDLADEMGFFITSEAFDMWEKAKTEYDYARFFRDWAYRDVKSWVLRDRNHPSLIMWSIGNEIYDVHADERGQEITRMLKEYVEEFDPKRNASVTIGSNYNAWENGQKCTDIVKLAGYNYGERLYHTQHAERPDWIIYGSETSSVVQSRGIYHFPFEKSIFSEDDEQCSALGNSPLSWGAKSAEACILAERDAPFSLGQFLWTGFDYIGEPTPYQTKNSYFGQIDTATFPKDPYYIYQAAWTDYRTHPMVHVFPYWDFNDGQMIDVRVCSNAPKIELQFNGSTVGTYDIDHQHGTQLVGWWKIPYVKGEIKAIAYDEEGNVIATDIQRSFGDAQRICLQADKELLTADGQDLIFVEIGMKDADGNPVANANTRVHVKVTGEGRLLGLDNGDSTDFDQYKGTSRRLFSGKLMAIIGATLNSGKINIEVACDGMPTETLAFESVVAASGVPAGIAANTRSQEMPCVSGNNNEVPLRKIEIISQSGQSFNESVKELVVQAKLYPENTTYQDIEWQIVTVQGIESNVAKAEANGLEAKITALGDGDFYLRCSSKNGTDKTKLISHLEYKITGLGTAYKDPYSFVSGGLFDYNKGAVATGNERAVAPGDDVETHIGFRNIDFGPFGSDTLTIPGYGLSSDPYELQIWEGMPGEEGSELLADTVYHRSYSWATFKEQTYKLPKRLRGITSICIVLYRQLQIKGFTFERQNRAFELNGAADNDHIYGDSFTVAGDCVEGIGNNVTLEFLEMDFSSEGTSRLVICGRSSIEKNTIHIQFSDENGENRQIVEFTQTDGYEEQVFELERVTGLKKVAFIFLPGSQFDFKGFCFER